MKRWIFENLGLKALAVLIAVLLWAYVGSRQVIEQRKNLRIEFNDVPAGVAMGPNVKTSVPVVMIGRPESFRDLDQDDFKAVVSLREWKPNETQIVVHPRIEPLPEGVNISVPDLTIPLVLPLKSAGSDKKKKGRK